MSRRCNISGAMRPRRCLQSWFVFLLESLGWCFCSGLYLATLVSRSRWWLRLPSLFIPIPGFRWGSRPSCGPKIGLIAQLARLSSSTPLRLCVLDTTTHVPDPCSWARSSALWTTFVQFIVRYRGWVRAAGHVCTFPYFCFIWTPGKMSACLWLAPCSTRRWLAVTGPVREGQSIPAAFASFNDL